jgi:hypothetical protein
LWIASAPNQTAQHSCDHRNTQANAGNPKESEPRHPETRALDGEREPKHNPGDEAENEERVIEPVEGRSCDLVPGTQQHHTADRLYLPETLTMHAW